MVPIPNTPYIVCCTEAKTLSVFDPVANTKRFSIVLPSIPTSVDYRDGVIIVGDEDGVLRVLYITETDLICIYNHKLHTAPIKYAKIDPTGSNFMSCGADGKVFLLQISGSAITILGYVDVAGVVVGACWYTSSHGSRAFVSVEGGDVYRMDVPKSAAESHAYSYDDVTASLMKTDYTPYNITMMPVTAVQHQTKAKTQKLRLGRAVVHHTAYKPSFMALSHDRKLKVYSMSDEYVGDPNTMDEADVAPADNEYAGHDKSGGVLCISNDNTMMLTGGADGYIRLYKLEDLSKPLGSSLAHDPFHVCIVSYY